MVRAGVVAGAAGLCSARGSGSRSRSGCTCIGPRRLISWIESNRSWVCSAGGRASSRRRGAGEDCAWAPAGRSRKLRPCALAAASCRRRSASARASGSHAKRAPKAALRRLCSTAQSRSAGRSARTSSRPRGSIPSWAQPSGYNRPWSASSEARTMIWRWALTRAARHGASRRISPMPGAGMSNSVRQRAGQPPPGSWASSAAKPLATLLAGANNMSPCQSRSRSGALRCASSWASREARKDRWDIGTGESVPAP